MSPSRSSFPSLYAMMCSLLTFIIKVVLLVLLSDDPMLLYVKNSLLRVTGITTGSGSALITLNFTDEGFCCGSSVSVSSLSFCPGVNSMKLFPDLGSPTFGTVISLFPADNLKHPLSAETSGLRNDVELRQYAALLAGFAEHPG